MRSRRSIRQEELRSQDLLEVESRGPPAPLGDECRRLLEKVRQLIEFDIEIRQDQALPTYHFQKQATRILDIPENEKVTHGIYRKAAAALGTVTLARALQWGDIWSIDDQDGMMLDCNISHSGHLLEENNETDTGESIVQGDLVAASCDERMLGEAGSRYRGCQTRTKTGLRCQHWDSQVPHAHAWTPDSHIEHDLSENFCRNPNGKEGIWCFTMDSKTRWEYCDPLPTEHAEEGSLVEPSTAKGIWTSGIVRYCYDLEMEVEAKIAMEKVMRSVQRQVPCLRFEQVHRKDRHNCVELPSVLIKSNADGCWGFLGQVSGFEDRFKTRSQLLNLGPGCELEGMAAHQLGHLLGLRHEANRVDRDDFLTVLEDNIDGPVSAKFPMSPASTLPSKGSDEERTFDLLSVMMSGPRAFSANGEATLEPRAEPRLGRYLGQRLGFSHFDIMRLGEMYGCLEDSLPESPSKVLSQLFLEGDGMLADDACKDENFTGVEYVDGTGIPKPYFCGGLATKCDDHEIGPRLRKRCPRTCLMCTPSITGNLAEHKQAPVTSTTATTTRANTTAAATTTRVNVTTTQDLGAPVPVDGCADEKFTGFRFRSGKQASCVDLKPFCRHRILGQKARGACPMTCGLCDSTETLEDKPAANATSCKDLGVEEAPMFTVRGKPAPCKALRQYCSGHEDSFLVLKKCPLSCGTCAPGNATTTTTTVTYTFSTAVMDSIDQGMNCSRRRRWGFCATRRRRFV